jgi:hypothetical protein
VPDILLAVFGPSDSPLLRLPLPVCCWFRCSRANLDFDQSAGLIFLSSSLRDLFLVPDL